MINIPGFTNYAFDPATGRVWSNLSSKYIKPLTGTSDIYYLKADNAKYQSWSRQFERTRISVSQIKTAISTAVKTSAGIAPATKGDKTRGKFIILSYNGNGQLQSDVHPKVYDSYEAGKEAAESRAKTNKGTRYTVFEMKGTVVSGDVVWS